MEDLQSKIKEITGRDIEVEEVTFQGQKGFLPIYFNYSFRNNISKVFSTNKEETLQKFYDFLLGESHATESGSERESSKENQSALNTDGEERS